MLHIKFQGNQSTGSREDICKVFTVTRHGGHIGLYKFLFPQPKEALKEIWLHLAQWGVGGVDVSRFFFFKHGWPFCLSERNIFSYFGRKPPRQHSYEV